eukprot:TRINITY_DN11380_c0_g1_i2.p1 TRINITY_DN11380_c0_g1~~TRINITY_DN11380_c0_g1_i2.p1  ORF type:complete len:220 (-),score=54.41 TRINITY_DN11380_c0_g1_i2:64-666(-)
MCIRDRYMGDLIDVKSAVVKEVRHTPQYPEFLKLFTSVRDKVKQQAIRLLANPRFRTELEKYKLPTNLNRGGETALDRDEWKKWDHFWQTKYRELYKMLNLKKLKETLDKQDEVSEQGSSSLRMLEALYFCQDDDLKSELLTAEKSMYAKLAPKDSEMKPKNFSLLRLLRFRRDITAERIINLYKQKLSDFQYLTTIDLN